jgi:hypothetical protein
MKLVFKFHGLISTNTGLYVELNCYMSNIGEVCGMSPHKYKEYTKKL